MSCVRGLERRPKELDPHERGVIRTQGKVLGPRVPSAWRSGRLPPAMARGRGRRAALLALVGVLLCASLAQAGPYGAAQRSRTRNRGRNGGKKPHLRCGRCGCGCGGGVPSAPPPPPPPADCSPCSSTQYEESECNTATSTDRVCRACNGLPSCPDRQYRRSVACWPRGGSCDIAFRSTLTQISSAVAVDLARKGPVSRAAPARRASIALAAPVQAVQAQGRVSTARNAVQVASTWVGAAASPKAPA